MKIVNLFTICILLSEMLLQVLTIRVNFTNCSSYKDQKKCSQNKCEWITKTKTCKAIHLSLIKKVNVDAKNLQKVNVDAKNLQKVNVDAKKYKPPPISEVNGYGSHFNNDSLNDGDSLGRKY